MSRKIVPSAQTNRQGVQSIRIDYTDKNHDVINGNTRVIGRLPLGAVITNGGFVVHTPFNDSGADTADIGTTNTSKAGQQTLGSDINLSSANKKLFDVNTSSSNYYMDAEGDVYLTWSGSQNGDATAGLAVAWVEFIIPG